MLRAEEGRTRGRTGLGGLVPSRGVSSEPNTRPSLPALPLSSIPATALWRTWRLRVREIRQSTPRHAARDQSSLDSTQLSTSRPPHATSSAVATFPHQRVPRTPQGWSGDKQRREPGAQSSRGLRTTPDTDVSNLGYPARQPQDPWPAALEAWLI